MTKDEALKLALEALEYIEHNYMSLPKSGETAITAIREALAQPEQEPVAWFEHNPDLDAWFLAYSKNQNPGIKSRPLVFGDTAPPQRKPEQKPVAHTLNCVCGAVWDIKSDGSEEMAHTPDTTPPQRKPLTDEEIWDEVKAADLDWQTGWSLDEDASNRYITFARAIEAAHGIIGEQK